MKSSRGHLIGLCRRALRRRLHEERGASAIEQAAVVAMVAIVAVGALRALGATLGGSDIETATSALGEEPVQVNQESADGPSAANGAGGSSGVFGGAASGVSDTGLTGGFVSDPNVGGFWNTHGAGSFIGEWEVLSGSVDAKVDGKKDFGDLEIDGQFMDLNGGSPGHIQRSVDVIPNQTYNLSVDLGENSFGGPEVKTMEVIWNGEVVSTVEVDLPNGELKTFTVQLPPSESGDGVLSFRSANEGVYGVLIDNPTLTLIPS